MGASPCGESSETGGDNSHGAPKHQKLSLSLSLDLLTYLPTFLPTDYLPPYSFTQNIDRNIHIGIDIDMHEAHAHMSTTTTNKIDFRRGSHCPSDCPGKVA